MKRGVGAVASRDRPVGFYAVIALLCVAAVGLSACGRKGPLEPPPGAAVTDKAGGPSAEPAKKPQRHFILDPLI
jgi:predicted small lipoprotein YifL